MNCHGFPITIHEEKISVTMVELWPGRLADDSTFEQLAVINSML
jgi:hypothetical protein